MGPGNLDNARLLLDPAWGVLVATSAPDRRRGRRVLEADFLSGEDRRGRRMFEASACGTVRDAAALAITLTVDPVLLSCPKTPPVPEETPRETRPSSPPEEDEPQAQIVSASPPIEVQPQPAPPAPEGSATPGGQPRPVWRAGLAAFGFVDGVALPGVGGGLAVAAAALRGVSWSTGDLEVLCEGTWMDDGVLRPLRVRPQMEFSPNAGSA